MAKSDIGVFGMGVMGQNLCLNAADNGFVVGRGLVGRSTMDEMDGDKPAPHFHNHRSPAFTRSRAILYLSLSF